MIQVWRLSRASRVTTAFTGEGTRLIGSRWTHLGLPAVYTSGSIALAVLESLVHMDIAHAGPHVVFPATIPDGVAIETLDIARLPANWYATPAPAVLRDFGSDWLKTQRTAVLAVPSAIVNDESNYILNPTHPDFAQIIIGMAQPFAFDGRLWSAP